MVKNWSWKRFYKNFTALTRFISAAADGSSSLLPGTCKGSDFSEPFFMTYTVYILFTPQFNKHYTGFTSNLSERMKSHNELGYDWTAKYRPWKLIYTKDFETKAEALTYEKWLKTGIGRDFIKTLPH